ncbi:MAG: cation:proton antiporter [Azonexus sp.]|nr:cation:proton antiporter [Azonexus sp.]MCK6410847.1 cation:proton antiporter [Azonexus sp.]
MTETLLRWPRELWESLLERLFFLPPFPESIDSLALFSLLLVAGLLLGEWLHRHWGWPKVVGYVLAGILCGPSLLGWISIEALVQARPIADAALGLLMLEVGRRLDLGWWWRSRELLRSTGYDIGLSFLLIFLFSWLLIGLSPAWSAATAAVTMASAPAVVLLTIEEAKGQGQVSERILLHTAVGSAASFFAFTVVLGIVHAEHSNDWLNAAVHPLWVGVGAGLIAIAGAQLALGIAGRLVKGSLAQVFVLVASAMLAVGCARMLAVPVFLTLFLMGVMLAARDRRQSLRYTSLPEGHWLLAIVLFVIVGASLPWQEFGWLSLLQALALLAVRATAKILALLSAGGSLSRHKRLLVGVGIQPLSATAVFMVYELASLYPEVGGPALALPLFAAAIMELLGPVLCRWALRQAGESLEEGKGNIG